MQIDDKTIKNLEDLSCLSLPDKEKCHISGDLQKIINKIEKINDLNTDGVFECTHPWNCSESSGYVNVFREDVVIPSFSRESILKNAPLKNDEYFIAPKTVE